MSRGVIDWERKRRRRRDTDTSSDQPDKNWHLYAERDSSAEPHSQQVLFQRRHEQVLQVINDDFTTNKNLSHNDDAMDELLKAHESIQSLDKSVAMLQMQSAAPMSSQEMSLDSSAAVSTLSREGSARKKVFMVIGINTDLVVERDVIQLERLGCLKEHVEGYHELSAKTKIFFSSEVAMWDAEFYVEVDDDVHVNLGMLASTLDRHRSKPRVYIACMKSGPVLSQKNVKYHEPEPILWFIGLEVELIDDPQHVLRDTTRFVLCRSLHCHAHPIILFSDRTEE
ncbi:hypothetical protein OIU77_019602 [Salix suchowensis]|uniref:Hexosyltransferase n=1 Tax=Salix suchowensis TaxID=1278906 RepID=A0ABQ9CGM0_9ROSI|nr:hypothetical protein OIU77_019602 [Salix suchowensis]